MTLSNSSQLGHVPRPGQVWQAEVEGFVDRIGGVAHGEELGPGIDAVALGPNDLSGTTGHFRQHAHPANAGAVDKVLAHAKAAGVPACLGVNSKPAELPGWLAKGVKLLLVTADLELLAAGSAEALRNGRKAIA